MRQDSSAFRVTNAAASKEPRYVIELAFDTDNTVLRYFSSHSDSALPPGALSIDGIVEGLAGTSQRIDPDKAVASIGEWSFTLSDVGAEATALLAGQLSLGRSTRKQRVRFYVGDVDLGWDDYSLVQTQRVEEISYQGGAYRARCADIQRALRQELFDLAQTNLAATLSATGTTVDVYDTSAFARVAHGTSYSDAPGQTVGYIKIDDEVIRYTGKTSTTFTGCTRGVLNTLAVEHNVDVAADEDRRQKVEEYVYLEMPAVKLALALLTGDVYTADSPTSSLPTSWHLGIDAAYITESDFTGIGADLWNLADDDEGFVVRFAGLTKTDGKQFIEQQLMLLLGCFMPVYADGSLGLKRMANVLAGAAYVDLLDETNIVSVGELVHDFRGMHNVIDIRWNWEPAHKDFTRRTGLIDAASITMHGRADPYRVDFRGLHGSRHSSVILRQRFDAIRDRYTGPPQRITVTVLPSRNVLEVGDVVRLRLESVRDFVANDVAGDFVLDRSWEVQQVQIDWVSGQVSLQLFASSQAPSAQAPTSDVTALSDAWYVSQGSALSSVLTITGSNPGHVSASGSITGNVSLNAAGAIYYYAGDLTIDAGVTVLLAHNVQIRVMGHLTINGRISGVGGGRAGASQISSAQSGDWSRSKLLQHNLGTAGFLGTTKSAGGYTAAAIPIFESYDGYLVVGAYNVVPSFQLGWDGTTLTGIPDDLRGTSGSTGNPTASAGAPRGIPVVINDYARGGRGGASGAGLVVVARGVSFGVSGSIELSGQDGALGESFSAGGLRFRAGSGAGGAPGGWLCILDGALANVPSLVGSFIADYGDTPIRGVPLSGTGRIKTSGLSDDNYPYYVGTGDGSTFPLPSLSGVLGGARVQYVPGNQTATADPSAAVLQPPSSLTLDSVGEAFVNEDGVTVPRIRAEWDSSPDPRTLGYELQFRTRSTDSPIVLGTWQPMPTLFGQLSLEQWIHPVRSAAQYDVRLRAVGAVREVSEWIEINGHTVGGDTTVPANVGSLSFSTIYLSWPANTDADLAGYIVRYSNASNSPEDWDAASAAHEEGFITETEFDTTGLPVGQLTMLVKAVDLSGNESQEPASLGIVNPDPDAFAYSNWTSITNPKNFSLNAIAHNGTMFVAVGAADGTDAYIVTSVEGTIWTERANPKNFALYGIAYSPALGMWVAVGGVDGTDAYIITSTNGTTWTERANPKNFDLLAVAWSPSLGMFVAVGGQDGTDAYIVTSTNGTTWTERSNPKNLFLSAVAWSSTLGMFAAVGSSSVDATDTYIITSTNGTSWTERSAPQDRQLNGIVWTGQKFVAVGGNGVALATVNVSEDGITWSAGTTQSSRALNSVAWNGTALVAVGNTTVTTGCAHITHSVDGLTWSSPIQNPLSRNLHAIVGNGSIFCAVGASSGGIPAYIANSLRAA